MFSQFFLLTLYMQQVLHYSAMQTGVAYVALTLAVIVFANVAQALALRVGIRRVLPVGLAARRRPRSCSTRALPVDGHYFWDLFPAFLIGGHRDGVRRSSRSRSARSPACATPRPASPPA